MDYKDIKTPFIGRKAIKNQADKFRLEYWGENIPVDIEKIIDVKMGIDIIPTPELEKLCNTDALISSDWQLIYIDKGRFDDERYQNRLRFSLAHEIGHLVLHKDFYGSFKIFSFEDFYKFFENISGDQYSYLEAQANKFASFLLVPREKLSAVHRETIDLFRKKSNIDFGNIEPMMLNSYLAHPIAKIFGVSSEAMEIILNE